MKHTRERVENMEPTVIYVVSLATGSLNVHITTKYTGKKPNEENYERFVFAFDLCCVCLSKPDFMFRRYHVFRVLTFIVLSNHQSNASLQDALHPFPYDDMSSLSNNQDSVDSSSSFVTPRNVKGSTLSSPPGHTLKSTAQSKVSFVARPEVETQNLDFHAKTPSTAVAINTEMPE